MGAPPPEVEVLQKAAEEAERVRLEKEAATGRGGTRQCRNFQKGYCRFGRECRFTHGEFVPLRKQSGEGTAWQGRGWSAAAADASCQGNSWGGAAAAAQSSSWGRPAQEQAAAPAFVPREEPVLFRHGEEASNPQRVLERTSLPQTIDQWAEVQSIVGDGHPTLPPNWIRIWSRSKAKEYYYNRTTQQSTFQIRQVM